MLYCAHFEDECPLTDILGMAQSLRSSKLSLHIHYIMDDHVNCELPVKLFPIGTLDEVIAE